MSLKINMAKIAAESETCASCGEPITNERVTQGGKVYHHGHQPGYEASRKTADLPATGCPSSGDGLHKWLRYTSDVLPITATCAYCGETAETGTRGGWGGTIGSKTALVWTQSREASDDSPTYRLHIIGTVGAEVYARSGQWFWNAWLAHGIESDGGPLEEPQQAQREAEAWLAGTGTNVVTGQKTASKTAVSPTEDWQKGYDDAINSEWVNNLAVNWDESMNGNEDYMDGFNAGSDAQDEAKRSQPRGEITTGEGFVAFEDPDDFLDAWLSSKKTLWELM